MCPTSENGVEKINFSPEDELRSDGASNDDDDDEWLASDFFGNYSDTFELDTDGTVHQSKGQGESADLNEIMLRLQRREGNDINDIGTDFRHRTNIVQAQMGSMPLCRGSRGEELRQSGAISALLVTLNEAFGHVSSPCSEPVIGGDEIESMQAIVLASSCWGAVRDLSCHNAGVRREVRTIMCASDNDDGTTPTNGLQLMTQYLKLYDAIAWNDIQPREHLKLLTNTIGAIRNVTHSTGDNCIELHEYGVTSLLTWRLLHDGPSLPDVSQPWREAAFRAGASLINMAEKCNDCAIQCARTIPLVHVLIECWGGKACHSMQKGMTLHLGLVAILQAAKRQLSEQEYAASWDDILVNEEKRKSKARQREVERKQRLEKA